MPINTEIFFLPFMQRAFLGGLLVALLTSFTGILVVLRRSSFLGDAISHSALAGVAIGLLFKINPLLTAIIFTLLVSFCLPYLEKKSALALDSLLGFLLPFSLALGVIILSLLPGYQPDLLSYLFGSILSIGWLDLKIIFFLSLGVGLVFLFLGKKLIFVSFDEDYARVSGLNVRFLNIFYSLILSLVIVLSIRLVGIILVNGLLVIPAATARLYTRSLKQMFLLTPLISVFCVVSGIGLATIFNWPVGPVIVAGAGIIFLSSVVLK